jgi:hypothetical protein
VTPGRHEDETAVDDDERVDAGEPPIDAQAAGWGQLQTRLEPAAGSPAEELAKGLC